LALPVGTTYWPEYITEEDLALTRESLDKAAWNSLYLQSPVGESGLIFQKELFREWEEAEPPHCDEIIISMDTAFSVRTTADFSSIQIWGIFYENEENEDGETVTVPNAILINRLKGRWTYPQLRKNALEQYKKCLSILNDYDYNTVGVDLVYNPALHYSGNFWWAKSNYIKTLSRPEDIPIILSKRHNAEFWVCNGNSKHYSLHNSNIPVYERHHHNYSEINYINGSF
jgi:hypothetical protein